MAKAGMTTAPARAPMSTIEPTEELKLSTVTTTVCSSRTMILCTSSVYFVVLALYYFCVIYYTLFSEYSEVLLTLIIRSVQNYAVF